MRAFNLALAATFAWSLATAVLAAPPVLQDLTLHMGALTRSAHGGVPLTSKDIAETSTALMQVSGEVPTSCTITADGPTTALWNLPTDCTSPTPKQHGLPDASYTFEVTATGATGTSPAETLTYSMHADVYTVSTPTQVSSSSTGMKALASQLGGKTIALARGSEVYFGGDEPFEYTYDPTGTAQGGPKYTVDFSKALTFSGFAPPAETVTTITSADADARTALSRLVVTGDSHRLKFIGLRVTGHLPEFTLPEGGCKIGATEQEGTKPICNAWTTMQGQQLILLSGAGGLYPGTITFEDMDVGAPGTATSPTQWMVGIQSTGKRTTPTIKLSNIVLDDIRVARVMDGIKLGDLQDSEISNFTIDSFARNALADQGAGSRNVHYRDYVIVRPLKNLATPWTHKDISQFGGPLPEAASTEWQNVTIERGVFATADGDTYAQGTFWRLTGTHAATSAFANATIRNVLYSGGASNGLTIGRGTGWTYERNGVFVDESRASGSLNHFPRVAATGEASTYGASGVFANNIVQGRSPATTTLMSTGLVASNNLFLDEAYTLPPEWTTTNNAPYADFYNQVFQDADTSGLDYASMTVAEIGPAIRAARAPIVGGPAMNEDGTYKGPVFPDGSWNDGAVYGQTPETAITSSAAVETAQVGQPVTITFNTDAVASQSISVDPAVSGVTGTFSVDPVTIGLGETSATTSFTATSAGSAVITATNNRSLTNPTALGLAIEVAPTAPTSYTLVTNRTVIPLGASITLTVALNQPATVETTISFTSNMGTAADVVIPFGQRFGVSLFYGTTLGTGTIAANDNQSLTDPAPLNVSVVRMVRGQLYNLLR